MVQSAVSHPMDELNKLNFFAAYNHIEPEFVEPDHAVFKLEIRPESKNPYGIVRADARVRHRGRTTCLVDVDILGEGEKLLATGEFTYFCIDPDIMAQKAAQPR